MSKVRTTRARPALVLAFALIAGWSLPAASQAPTQIRVGMASPTGVALPVWAALTLGLDKAENLTFVPERMNTTLTVPSLIAGKVDTMASSAELAIAKGAKIRLVAGGFRARGWNGLYASKKSGITSLKDLKGRRIGINKYGDPQYVMVEEALKRAGLTAADVTFMYQSPPQRAQSLIAGALDAGIMFPPYSTNMQKQGAAIEVSDLKFTRDYQSNAYAMNDSFIAENPDAVARFARVISKAIIAIYDEANWPAFEKTFYGYMNLTPAQFDMRQYLQSTKAERILNEFPTRELLQGNIFYVEALPEYATSPRKLKVDDLIYVTPEFRDKFEGKVPSVGAN